MTSPSSAPPSTADPRDRLRTLINGYTWTQVLHAAARLRLADHLAAGPLKTGELAASSGADPDILYRLLNGMASIGVVVAEDDGRIRLTPSVRVCVTTFRDHWPASRSSPGTSTIGSGWA